MSEPPVASSTSTAPPPPGPAESKHLHSRRYQEVINSGGKVTPTHWYVAWAGALGWMIDSIGFSFYALIIPQLIDEFGSNLDTMTFDLLIAGLFSAGATYFWPWLSDKIGRRPSFIVNVTLSAIFLILTGLAWSWGSFILFYALFMCSQVGEWGIASCLMAETWPARNRAKVLSFARSFYGYGAALTGVIGVALVTSVGWRIGYFIPAAIALLALFVRIFCPESPYWLRTKDRKTRLRAAVRNNEPIDAADAEWVRTTSKPSWGQLFLRDQRRRTIVAVFVAVTASAAFSTVGTWQPLYLHDSIGWTTGQYSTYIIWWGLAGTMGYYVFGWLADRHSRIMAMLAGNCLTIATIIPWALSEQTWAIYTFGLLANFGLIGVWGTVMAYTAELFPTRIRGVGQGFAWGLTAIITRGVPYAALLISTATGSFQLAFLLIPALLIIQLIGLAIAKTEYAGKELDEIAV